ncbi:MAG: DUF5668 domain-containing protein [Lachnospiraceae bacterium]|nr:DUF5668 domain-containing protein [Lachnospiraceae bacterium]
MENGNKTIRIRRLGSVTFGIVLIGTGLLMSLNVIFPSLNINMLFRFWPLILVILGVEVLIGSQFKSTEVIRPDGQVIEQNKVIYDIPAVIMMGITLFVAFMLAFAEWAVRHEIGLWWY